MELMVIINKLNAATQHLENALTELDKVRVGTAKQVDAETFTYLEGLVEHVRGGWSAVNTLAFEAQEQLEGHSHHVAAQ